MWHRAVLLALALLAGCARPQPLAPRPVAAVTGPVCRLGPDGAMPSGTTPLADRGIGGTGTYADRGIGGTGIEKTGILGVITGFGSVCIGGQEVGYDPAVPVLVDGRPGALADLRAGQVTAIDADGPLARRVQVRHEVSGPLDRVEADGALIVLGQRVVPVQGAWGSIPPPGSWLDVSGFRQSDGTVRATRLDPRRPGEALVRGILARAGGQWRIGELEVRPAPGQFVQAGIPIVAVGLLRAHVLYADTVEPDGLLIDPATYFGPGVGVLLLEGYAEGGRLRFGRGLDYGAPFAEGRVLTRLERRSGGFVPAFVRPSGPAGFSPTPFGGGGFQGRPRFEPAPTPNRGFDRQGPGGRGGAPGGPAGREGRGGFRGGGEGQDRQGGGGGEFRRR